MPVESKLPYSRESLVELVEKGGEFDYYLFYGHKKSPDGTITDACLSQWFEVAFEVDGIEYLTAEQFMMAEKARLFDDAEMLQEILTCKTPKEAKALGRKVRNFDKEAWDSASFEIVVRGNQAKFSQNADLEKFLLSTAPKVLVEASPRDRIWGIGLGKANPKALDPGQWRGRNQLGFALMKARDLLAEG
ncbi:MAG: NADAR family protein [Cyanobacteria bacterium HKST-UBA01]|nr:NADAR family protein [Cyanobacteria bacterium HKST-UBA01]